MRNPKTKRATIKQVAQDAGVSIGTVSNYLNKAVFVSKETSERISEAISRLNYIPNNVASSLRRKTNTIIDVLTPNMNNPFYSKILSRFTTLAYEAGYTVHIYGYEYSVEREIHGLQTLHSNMPGTVIIFNGHDDENEIRNLMEQGISVILADRDTKLEDVPYIAFDNRKVLLEITTMLKKKGYKRVGLVTEPPSIINIKERNESFVKAAKKSGFDTKEQIIFCKENLCLDNLENGYLYMKSLLQEYRKEELPDAWVATSDLLAIGIARAFNEAGYKVPRDFGVIGFDNIDVSGYVHPTLTTVNQDQERMGTELWKMVKENNEGKRVKPVILPQELIIRESC